jgi:chromosome segregation ATPase
MTTPPKRVEDEDDSSSPLSRCQQEVAELRHELQELRESTDDDYAIAVTMAAKERGLLQVAAEKLQQEADELRVCSELQQAHIDSLTNQVIHLEQEKDEQQCELTSQKVQLNKLQTSMESIQTIMKDFQVSWDAYWSSKEKKDTHDETLQTAFFVLLERTEGRQEEFDDDHSLVPAEYYDDTSLSEKPEKNHNPIPSNRQSSWPEPPIPVTFLFPNILLGTKQESPSQRML